MNLDLWHRVAIKFISTFMERLIMYLTEQSNNKSQFAPAQKRSEPMESTAAKLSSIDKFVSTEVLKGCCTQGCCNGGGFPL